MLMERLRTANAKTIMMMFPIIFLLHDAEEILTMEKWVDQNFYFMQEVIPKNLHSFLDNIRMSIPEIVVAVLVEFMFIIVTTVFMMRYLRSKIMILVYTGMLTVLFLNVFTHVVQAVAYQGYTPGVVTALFVSLPYSIYAYQKLFQAKLVNRRILLTSFFVAFLLFPIVPLAQFVGRMLV